MGGGVVQGPRKGRSVGLFKLTSKGNLPGGLYPLNPLESATDYIDPATGGGRGWARGRGAEVDQP